MPVRATSGTIVTIAGTGEPGYSGDGGPATAACLNEPKSVALDAQGRLYIADSENHLIRRVDLATGMMTTIAGLAEQAAEASPLVSTRAAAGHDFDDDPLGEPRQTATHKIVQQADLSGTVRFLVGTPAGAGRFGGDGGPATRATLNFPSAVAVDEAGNFYIGDTMNHRVRKVDVVSGTISTIAGTGQRRFSGDGGPATAAALNEPAALVVDDRGSLFVADQSNNRVRRVDLASGIITTVAGTGESAYTGDGVPAVEAGLAGPSGLALGADGILYLADTFNGRIRAVDLTTGLITTMAGDGSEYRYQGVPQEFSTSLSRPYGIAIEASGDILVTDSDSHLIRRCSRRKKIITRVAGNGKAGYSGDGGPPQESSLNYPFGVAVDRAGNLYIADTFNHRIRLIAV